MALELHSHTCRCGKVGTFYKYFRTRPVYCPTCGRKYIVPGLDLHEMAADKETRWKAINLLFKADMKESMANTLKRRFR